MARIAIVGAGGVFPAAPTPGHLWERIRTATDTARDVPPGRWLLDPDDAFDPAIARPDRVYSRRGCFVDPFTVDDSGIDLPPGLLAELDPVFHLALEAGRQAFRPDVARAFDPRRVGVILGNIVLPTEKATELTRVYLGATFAEKVHGRAAAPGFTPSPFAVGTSLPAGVLARALGLGGGSCTLDAACASSLYALKLACDELAAGRADAMLAGGVSRPDCLYTQMGFSQLRALSPSGRCSPFDAGADGLVVGEGAGVFLLERLEDARRHGHEALAVIAGIGLSNDVGGGLLAPNGEGQLRAMHAAYRAAGWAPHEVDLIECHATGTPVGDAVEYQSLRTLWEGENGRPGQCVLGSVKSTVGHLLTGAGAAGVTKVLFALRAGVLPPTANFTTPAPALDFAASPFRVLTSAETWQRRPGRPRRAAVSAFGFGGTNAHVLLEEAPDRSRPAVTGGWEPPEATPPHAPPIAVVGMEAHVGPWPSLRAFQECVLGGGEGVEARAPRHWWGVPESDWFRALGFDAAAFAGFYLDEVAVPGHFRIPPRELAEALPQQLLMLQVAARALDAVRIPEEGRTRTGVFIGLGLDLNTTNFHLRWSLPDEDRALRDAAGPALNANRTMGALGSIVASRIAREFHFGGPSFTLCGEETSGLRALEKAVRALQLRELDHALVGAVDLAGDVRAVLASRPHRPYSATSRARPFDTAADGTVPGEGAVALVLKRLEDAERDGDTIHAIIRGIGMAAGGDLAELVPDSTTYRKALERAYADAGIDPATVAHVEAHGSGRPAEDRAEAVALAAFFGAGREYHPPTLGSVKADVGHTGAAAGLVSLVKACLCLDHQVLPPLHNFDRPRPELGDAFRLPAAPQHWLRDRRDGPRRAGVTAFSLDGNCAHVVLEGWQPAAPVSRPGRACPLGPHAEALFVVEGADPAALIGGLGRLGSLLEAAPDLPVEAAARAWFREHPPHGEAAAAVAFVTDRRAELLDQIQAARRTLARDPTASLAIASPALRDRVFYSPAPLGRAGQLALLYPGSGNDFPGMGRDLALRWPDLPRRQDAENERLRSQFLPEVFWSDTPAVVPTVRERIFGQVALAGLVTDLLALFGVRPAAALGYSLGESAALFALRAWAGRDRMLQAMHDSPLFVRDLAGPCDVARTAWGLHPGAAVDYLAGVVDRPPGAVRAALAGEARAYLLIVNTPRECVLGGERAAVERVVRRLGSHFLPLTGAATVHCPVARVVADAYRDLHRLPTTPPPGVRFYSTALGRAYDVNEDSAAEALLAHALDTVDFPAVVEAAYCDGVRLFVETGPGASCTRMIDATLGDRPHRARSACVAGADGVSTLLRLLALLAAERVPLDLHALYPPDAPAALRSAADADAPAVVVPVGGRPFVLPSSPRGEGPEASGRQNGESKMENRESRIGERRAASAPVFNSQFSILDSPFRKECPAPLDLIAQAVTTQEARGQAHAAFLRFSDAMHRTVADGVAFQATLLETLLARGQALPEPVDHPPVALDRGQCLEFAVGSIGRVLGPDYAAIDAHPTRVRLPDEPLMLVDRILTIEGESRTLHGGRVVTEHDVHPGAWYLDGGRIPTCIAVEAGQADLFLAGYLGIDFRTHGLAVYRLLDAGVTFHRGLPTPGEVIRYDIRIDRFFRQGDVHLFKFHFEGTVHGEPLLTMTDGCAGFFTAADLAAGRGIVEAGLDRRPRAGTEPDDAADLPPVAVASYDEAQVDALRSGDVGACFGPPFVGLRLPPGLRLPGGRMRLVHRIPHLDPRGGRFGIGLVRGEADVHPDDWFLTCHFVDDRVMPGTLMYECCLHTLRIFLLRLGWVGGTEGVVCEPVPGVASRLKCRGQVTAATRTVTYEVTLKERGYRPEPYALADARMLADGKPIVEIINLSVRLTGLTREAVADTWGGRRSVDTPALPVGSRLNEDRRPALYDAASIRAFAVGRPSEAFGEPYRVFDEGRFLARLPGPPYLFLDRVTRVEGEPWRMTAGAAVETQYDVPPDAWYFAADRQEVMPFAVLLEVPLQACGWLAAYVGSALTSPDDLHFRNLGGDAELLAPVTPDAGTLTTQARLTRVARSAGMIIQGYEFTVRQGPRPVYCGTTTFGFFTRAALAQQVGIRDAAPHDPGPEELAHVRSFGYPGAPPFPDGRLRMIDRIEALLPDGGPHGLGFARGVKRVVPDEWFFAAHFYQDPVCPGSLGLESLVQLLKALAAERWGADPGTRFETMLGPSHRWLYRGQVVPSNREVRVEATVTARADAERRLTGDGFLWVDGLVIYQMTDFTLTLVRSP